jgi:uncharacterized membrane protein
VRVVLAVVNGVLAVAYPVAIWWALTHRSPRTVGLVALAIIVPLVAIRVARADRTHLWPVLRVPLSVMALLLAGTLLEDPLFFLILPVLISLALLAQFAASLRGEMPIIERFARMQEPALSPAKQTHCRQVTVAWCVFFVLNAMVCAALALWAPTRWWAIYAGGIAYGLMGSMFVGEYVLRKARFRDYGRGPHDRLLARLFPPPPEERAP